MLAERPRVYNNAEELTARYRNQYMALYDKSTDEFTPIRISSFFTKGNVLYAVSASGENILIGDEFSGQGDIVPVWDAPPLGWTQTRVGAHYVKSNTARQYLRGFHTNLLLFNGKYYREAEVESKEYRALAKEYEREYVNFGKTDKWQALAVRLKDMDRNGTRWNYSYSVLAKEKMDRAIDRIAPFYYTPKYVSSVQRLNRLLDAGKSAALSLHIAIIPAIGEGTETVVMFNDNVIGTYDKASANCLLKNADLLREYIPDWIGVSNAV